MCIRDRLSGVSSAVVSVDAQHHILLANAAAESLIGQSAETLTGQPLGDVAPELAALLSGGEQEGIVQRARRDAEPATLAAKAVAQGDGFVLSFEAVSYTHLDVYKRQLIGSRVARARAERTMDGGNGRLHVRLVALFSLIAATPTLLVVIFASLLFQFGVDFWFSDRSRGMFENAASLAQGYYQENQREVSANTFAMAKDLSDQLLSLIHI